MKKALIIFGSVLLVQVATSQVVIDYKTHALKAGENNPMTICDYVDPGLEQGENVSWDFSSLLMKTEFTGYLRTPVEVIVPGSNTELEENDSKFFFSVEKSGIKQTGYSSIDGKTKIIYDSEPEKIRFPFKYGDYISGSFTGSYSYLDQVKGQIDGSYSVEAEADGSLKLPGNIVFDKTLRVVCKKKYTTSFENSSQEVDITTYRWYNQYHRYPLLVLTKYTTTTGTSVTTNYQAAYNSDAAKLSLVASIQEQLNILIYPQPVSSDMFVNFTMPVAGAVKFSVYNMQGQMLCSEAFLNFDTGSNTYKLTKLIKDLMPGSYILTSEYNSAILSNEFTILR